MKKQKSQVVVSGETTVAMKKAAKELVKTLTTRIDGDWSPVECMEFETENIYAITTFRPKVVGYDRIRRECVLKRISPMKISVMIKDCISTPVIMAEFFTEGTVEGRKAMVKIGVFGKWKDDWHQWEKAEENGAPEVSCAEVYFAEE